MSRGINKVILVGNVGNDPEVKYTQGGTAVARVSLATTSVRRDRDGNTQERTEWHTLKFFGKLAEIVEQYVKKGNQIYVEGLLHYDKYTGQDGNERYVTEILCGEMQMLGGPGGQQQSGRQQSGSGRPAQATRSAPSRREYDPREGRAPARQPAQQERPTQERFDGDFQDDDIPF